MGEVFAGRYELVDPIGRGGVGAVWRAWDHRRRRYVAAKVLQQSDAHTLLRFVREQAVRIDHPHVLAPASWAADDDKVLFTMDLVSGGSLAHVIGDYGPLPPRFVCVLLDQLLAGLAAVHAEGVVHRDIKPANILLEATGTRRPHLRLSDFGISMRKGEPRLTETNYVVGTPGYFAPEQMMGAEPDFPADLFAVGLVALYLLEGQKPDSKALVDYFTEHGTPGAPQGIPEPLWQVLAGLLQPDPNARFRTATGARKALTAAVEMLPEPADDDEPVEVFDQLGPLPHPFGPEGPVTGSDPNRAAGSPQAPSYGNQHTGGITGGVTGGLTSGAAAGMTGGTTAGQPPQDGRSAPWTPDAPSEQRQPATGTSMSETGSFHLPPPPQAERQQAPQHHSPQYQPHQPPSGPHPLQPSPPAASYSTPTHPLASPPAAPDLSQAPTTAVPHDDLQHTRRYTAQQPGVPAQYPPTPYAPTSGAHTPAHAAAAPLPHKRPGPPPKVTIPVLLLALICFAVGFWALSQT
ncbi:serine/threonine protein kinase [Streptomyces camponoticapitis]|uniref:non-specific serine/threonine protein kinase n=1 Tax=Streptomyces camponoticapitis TaxID=1616125 RepID=A0ABQ2E1X7_9ACTN|nr:serine/threonine-protein kinase [Streptomyces camponoticapitis]GGJ81626.1 serine/threonine protein kinase [Streptomyces camponoticapitis]